MTKFLSSLAAAVALLALPMFANADTTTVNTGESRAETPRTTATGLRLIPAFGASSFTTGSSPDLKHFDGSYAAGLFADIGSAYATFETGIMTFSARSEASNGNASFHVSTWGVPLLGKFNFSGNPHETLFVKAGVMPYTSSGDGRSGFNAMGVGGVGANLALGQNSSILLDASYNRLFTRSGNETNYQGLAFLAGLSFNI